MKIETTLKHSRSTKRKDVYIDENPDAPIPNIYVPKGMFGPEIEVIVQDKTPKPA